LSLQVKSVPRYGTSQFNESGLFAARFIPRGQFVSFYSGLVISCDVEFFALTAREVNADEDEERTAYLLSVVKKEKDYQKKMIFLGGRLWASALLFRSATVQFSLL
jgi:hypothetical protein